MHLKIMTKKNKALAFIADKQIFITKNKKLIKKKNH